MKFSEPKKHVIDIVFPIALFFVFAASALTAILCAAKIYQSTTERSEEHYAARVSLSYISEKIRQNDVGGNVSIGKIGDADSLILRQDMGGTICTTYIYEYGGMLKELFVKEGAQVSPASGKDMIAVSDFSMRELSDNLFEFTAVTETGYSDSVTVGIRSRKWEDTP